MIDENDIQVLEHRFDQRYKLISEHGAADKLRELMDEAPDEQTRRELERLAAKMER